MAGCFHCGNVGQCVCNDGQVLTVGKLDACGVCKDCIALRAVPVLVSTVLMAGSGNLGNVNQSVVCNDGQVLAVGELSACFICKDCIAFFAVPVLCTAVLVAGCFHCGNVGQRLTGNGDVLNVGNVSACCVGEDRAAVLAGPVLGMSVLVANSLCCGNVGQFFTGNGQAQTVGEHGACGVCEYCITVGTVPILVHTVLVADGFVALYVYQLVQSGDYQILTVGEHGACGICEYCVAILTVPVLIQTGLVASCLVAFHVSERLQSGNGNVLDVGDHSAHGICEHCAAICTVPVLGVTVLVAGCFKCCNVGQFYGSGDHQVLTVGELDACCICKYCIAFGAVPVLVHTGLVADGFVALYVYQLVECGDGQAQTVGNDGSCFVGVVYVAISAVPVLVHTGLVATGLNCIEMLKLSAARTAFAILCCFVNQGQGEGKIPFVAVGDGEGGIHVGAVIAGHGDLDNAVAVGIGVLGAVNNNGHACDRIFVAADHQALTCPQAAIGSVLEVHGIACSDVRLEAFLALDGDRFVFIACNEEDAGVNGGFGIVPVFIGLCDDPDLNGLACGYAVRHNGVGVNTVVNCVQLAVALENGELIVAAGVLNAQNAVSGSGEFIPDAVGVAGAQGRIQKVAHSAFEVLIVCVDGVVLGAFLGDHRLADSSGDVSVNVGVLVHDTEENGFAQFDVIKYQRCNAVFSVCDSHTHCIGDRYCIVAGNSQLQSTCGQGEVHGGACGNGEVCGQFSVGCLDGAVFGNNFGNCKLCNRDEFPELLAV